VGKELEHQIILHFTAAGDGGGVCSENLGPDLQKILRFILRLS